MGSDPLYPRHGRRPATAKSPQARLGSVDARHRLQPNVDVIISFFVRIPQGGGGIFRFFDLSRAALPRVAFLREGRALCPTICKKPDTRQRGGLCGSRRSSGVATHREATALKRKRRRARRGLWPSDGAPERVPSVELRPERTAAPLYVFLRTAADSLHLARDFDDDLERLRKAVNGLRQLGEIDLQR